MTRRRGFGGSLIAPSKKRSVYLTTAVSRAVSSTGVFACALGGADGRTLFICTTPDFDEGRRKQAREASLLTARVDIPHAGLP